ncbi:hypothetical protein Tco_0782251 [Tanacetum coccineum]
MPFSKRSDTAPVCHSKPLDSVKNWNDHFFGVDSKAFPLSVSVKNKILSKDPPPKLHSRLDLFASFIHHSDPAKVRVGERSLADRELKLLKMTEGRTVALDPPATAALGGSGDNIDRLFDEGDDAGQQHSAEKDDDVQEEVITKDASEVVAEKPQKKQKRKVTGDASGSALPPKKLRDDH